MTTCYWPGCTRTGKSFCPRDRERLRVLGYDNPSYLTRSQLTEASVAWAARDAAWRARVADAHRTPLVCLWPGCDKPGKLCHTHRFRVLRMGIRLRSVRPGDGEELAFRWVNEAATRRRTTPETHHAPS